MESCPRTELVSKLKKVADALGNRRRLISGQRQETIKESKNEKYISKWVPDYTNFKLCQHPLYPFPRPPNDVQLLASDIVGMCLCLKRNGLQDDCPKLGCRGVETKRCVTRPIPTCVPSGLGRLPPKPIRISRPKVLPHPEVVRSNRMKRANEKKQRILRYINMGSKNYTNEYCSDVFFKPCHRHDGTYVRKTLKRDKTTEIDDYCYCKNSVICECKGTPSEMCASDSYTGTTGSGSKTEDVNSECKIEDLKTESKSEEPNASQVENVFRDNIDECKETINVKMPLKENEVISNPSKDQSNLSSKSFEKSKLKTKNIPDFCNDKDTKQTVKVVKL